MQNNSLDLTKILVEKNLITPGTNISARISVSGFGYAPIVAEREGKVVSISENGVKAVYDEHHRTTKFEDIMSIEGMEISRFAQAYRIKFKKPKPKKK
jgi:hypothetical protein